MRDYFLTNTTKQDIYLHFIIISIIISNIAALYRIVIFLAAIHNTSCIAHHYISPYGLIGLVDKRRVDVMSVGEVRPYMYIIFNRNLIHLFVLDNELFVKTKIQINLKVLCYYVA